MGTPERTGSEKTVIQDEVTGRTIWRLTQNDGEDKHAYYDICPWSSDQNYILFSTAKSEDLTTQVSDLWTTNRGEVYVMDTETCELKRIAENAYYSTHNGVFSMWHPKKPLVYFVQAPGKVGVANAETGKVERVMDGRMRQLSPDGELFVTTTPEGVSTMKEDGSDLREIVSLRELYDLTPNSDRFTIDQMTATNTKWRPDAQYVLIGNNIWHGPQNMNRDVRRSLYIVSRDGSEKRFLCFFGHHHSWTGDGAQVLYSGWKELTDDGLREDPRLFLVNFDGSGNRVVIEEPLGGHPIANPDGTLITTWDSEGVILVDINAQKVEHVTSFKPGFDMTHMGTHPHCVWHPDGSQILYNSAQTGHSQLYILPV